MTSNWRRENYITFIIPKKQDNGNCIFDKTISLPDMSDVDPFCDLDIEVPMTPINDANLFIDNVIIYISGFIMRKLIQKEQCTYCYTFLTENKQRVSCNLIRFRQLGGLVYPIFEIVTIVQITNRAMESALAKDDLCNVLKSAVNLTKNIVAEIYVSNTELLSEIGLHDEQHRLNMIKTIVFTMISLKGKHLCRTTNIETSTMIRHKNTKEVIFKHE